MIPSRCVSRPTALRGIAEASTRRATVPVSNARSLQHRQISSTSRQASNASSATTRRVATAAALAVVGGTYISFRDSNVVHAETKPMPVELTFETARKKPKSTEDNRDIISSQHLQVKKSWENPGVYAWGSNSGRVVAPDSDETNIKNPRRIAYFDGKALRDLKLSKDFGAAITEKGDLVQWGTAFSKDCREPVPTLKGKNLVKIAVSKDRILGLSAGGDVYSVPVAKDQLFKSDEGSGWFSSGPSLNYLTITPKNLGWGEQVSDISSGLEHALLLTSKGRVYSAASATADYPSKGQLGIAGLTWASRPAGPFYQPHEIPSLHGMRVTQIATGDNHSVVLDKMGRVFAFGKNDFGQLGFEYNSDMPYADSPVMLSINNLYKGSNQIPKVTNIAAGGSNTFLSVDAKQRLEIEPADPKQVDRITADTWGFGQGIVGSLGNGRWTHLQDIPTKIKSLSGLSEYDEQKNVIVPIRVANFSIGATHSAAVLDNYTQVSASETSSENETNFGSDVLLWGGNECFQLGTGKRNNISTPSYIPPLDKSADKEKGRLDIHRFQITPKKAVKINGRKTNVEQRIVCGRDVTGVYSAMAA